MGVVILALLAKAALQKPAIGRVTGAEYQCIEIEGKRYPAEWCQEKKLPFSGADRGKYLGRVTDGNITMRVFSVKGDERGEVYLCPLGLGRRVLYPGVRKRPDRAAGRGQEKRTGAVECCARKSHIKAGRSADGKIKTEHHERTSEFFHDAPHGRSVIIGLGKIQSYQWFARGKRFLSENSTSMQVLPIALRQHFYHEIHRK